MRRTKKSREIALAYKLAPWKWTGRPKNNIAKFWGRIDKRGPDECWNWQGATNNTGYGSFRIGGPKLTSHRIAYWDTHGGISQLAPGDKRSRQFVLHKCDNRLCCNPDHLFLGNYDDNIRDAKLKGRTRAPRGGSHPRAALSNEQAQKVRELLKSGSSRKEMQKLFGVSERIIDRIARNEGYKSECP